MEQPSDSRRKSASTSAKKRGLSQVHHSARSKGRDASCDGVDQQKEEPRGKRLKVEAPSGGRPDTVGSRSK